MNTHANKTSENKSQSAESRTIQKKSDNKSAFQFTDNRPETVVQKKLNKMANNGSQNDHLKTFSKMAQSQGSAAPIQMMKITAPEADKFKKKDSENPDQFRLRMKSEMDDARQSATKEDDSQLPENYLTKLRSERTNELEDLRSGNLPKGQEMEADKTPGGTTVTKTELAHESIRTGATAGVTPFLGGKGLGKAGSDLKVKTLSGGNIGTLENNIQNPSSAQRPREGLAARQQSVMATAKKADRFMETLDAGGDLSATHAKAKYQTTGSGNVKAGFNVVGTGVRADGSAEDIHGYGANEFGNKPDNRPGGLATPERLLPDITNHPGGTDPNGAHSRIGRWSEADVDPQVLGPHPSGNPAKYSYGPRNSERLLHTASGTQVRQPDGSSAPIDYRFHVTADHYESAVPITPVQKDYKTSHPYTSPYMDPTGKKSSFQIHKEAEDERIRIQKEQDALKKAAETKPQVQPGLKPTPQPARRSQKDINKQIAKSAKQGRKSQARAQKQQMKWQSRKK